MFALLEQGRYPVTSEDIATAAGVSPSSVFRYFEGLDDLQHQTVTRYFERFAPLFDIPAAEDRAGRIEAFVDARLALYAATAPLARVARARALDHEPLSESLAATRRDLSRQIAEHFGPELAGLGRADRSDVIALVDALTSFESWDLLHTTQGRSSARIQRAWVVGLERLLPAT